MDHRDETAGNLREIARELEVAAAHCRTAATHLDHGEIPRFAAHCWAAHGHVSRASDGLETESRAFADRSVPEIRDEGNTR